MMIYRYVCVYIYIERERWRCIYIYIYIYVYLVGLPLPRGHSGRGPPGLGGPRAGPGEPCRAKFRRRELLNISHTYLQLKV